MHRLLWSAAFLAACTGELDVHGARGDAGHDAFAFVFPDAARDALASDASVVSPDAALPAPDAAPPAPVDAAPPPVEDAAHTDDPCFGQGDGNHCGADLGGLADHGAAYQCQGGRTAHADPCPDGCEGGSCRQPPADPCASAQSGNGAYCGGSLNGGDGNSLYVCRDGHTEQQTGCPSGCHVNPPGVADACAESGDPCAQAHSGDGLYCGSSLGAGEADVLYDCHGGAATNRTPCDHGCQQNPPGVADTCRPGGDARCCVQRPAGVVTQGFTACGNGGSHYGIDYGTAIGTPIYAGISGTVVGHALGFPNCWNGGCDQSCWNSFNYVKLRADCGDPANGGNDLFVWYLHISDLAPGIGDGAHVDQGQILAYSGNSGCSSGPHVHLEVASVPRGQNTSLNTCNSLNPDSRACN